MPRMNGCPRTSSQIGCVCRWTCSKKSITCSSYAGLPPSRAQEIVGECSRAIDRLLDELVLEHPRGVLTPALAVLQAPARGLGDEGGRQALHAGPHQLWVQVRRRRQ